MGDSLQLFSGNLLHMMRGALMMLFVGMCINLYPRRKENSILNYLFWLLIVMSVFLLVSFGFMFDGLKNSENFCNFKILTDLCLVPLVGALLLKIMIPEWLCLRRTLLLIVPTAILMVVYTLTHNKLAFSISFIYAITIAAAIFVFILYLSVRYDRYLKNNFSNIDNKTLGWVRTVVYFFAAWYAAWGVIIKTDSCWLDSGYYLFLIIIWIFIYRHSMRHVAAVNAQELFESQIIELGEPKPEIAPNKFANKIEQYMNDESLWRNPTLTLRDFAALLNTNRTYLSEYINKTLETNFYDYLNSFRIKHACEVLLSIPDLSLDQVGERSGFNSISTFRRVFQKHIGCTPAQYRKQKLGS